MNSRMGPVVKPSFPAPALSPLPSACIYALLSVGACGGGTPTIALHRERELPTLIPDLRLEKSVGTHKTRDSQGELGFWSSGATS